MGKRSVAGLVGFSVALASCTTTSTGEGASAERYRVSCRARGELGTEQHRVLTCDFLNRSAVSVAFKVKSVAFPDPALGQHLAAESEVANYTKELQAEVAARAELSRTIGLLMIGAAVVLGGAKGGSGAGGIGALAAASGASTAPTTTIAGYLLPAAFSVEPGATSTRMLLLNLPRATLRPDAVTLCLDQPEATCVAVDLHLSPRERGDAW